MHAARLQLALKEAEKKKSGTATRGAAGKEDLNSLHDLRDQLTKEKEKVDELTHQLKEERSKSDNAQTMERSESD